VLKRPCFSLMRFPHSRDRVGKVGKWGLPNREGDAAYERASSVTIRVNAPEVRAAMKVAPGAA
jgi:hypothetical protein